MPVSFGIFLDQENRTRVPHWQMESSPLDPQGRLGIGLRACKVTAINAILGLKPGKLRVGWADDKPSHGHDSFSHPFLNGAELIQQETDHVVGPERWPCQGTGPRRHTDAVLHEILRFADILFSGRAPCGHPGHPVLEIPYAQGTGWVWILWVQLVFPAS